jgi:hypothetical protein
MLEVFLLKNELLKLLYFGTLVLVDFESLKKQKMDIGPLILFTFLEVLNRMLDG